MAVEAIHKQDAIKIESQYTCAALETSQVLHEWREQSTTNKEQLSWFTHVLIVHLKLSVFSLQVYKSTVLRKNVGVLSLCASFVYCIIGYGVHVSRTCHT